MGWKHAPLGLLPLAVTMQLDAPFPLTPALSPRRGRTIWQRNQGHRLVSFPTRSKRLPLLGERAGVRGNARFEVHGYGLVQKLGNGAVFELEFFDRPIVVAYSQNRVPDQIAAEHH